MENLNERVEKLFSQFYFDNKNSNFLFNIDEARDSKNIEEGLTKLALTHYELWDEVLLVLKENIVFTHNYFYIFDIRWGGGADTSPVINEYKLSDFIHVSGKPSTRSSLNFLLNPNKNVGHISFKNEKVKDVYSKEIEYFHLLDKLKENVISEIIKLQQGLEQEKLEEERLREKQRKEKLNVSQNNILKELDKDGNGEVDVVEGNDFSLLLKKHQKSIIEIDRTYVQQFVKVSSYLKTKKNNVQLIFNSIKDTSNEKELNEYVGILKNEIQTYSLILFNSLNMIVSLVEDDMITFYEIHESFDKLNIFNSNWENEVSQKLSNIGNGLSNLMYSIEEMGQNIVNEIGYLSYVTEESNQMLSNQLQDIDSSLQTNNLLTGIQTYQMYKVNKNTKGLRE